MAHEEILSHSLFLRRLAYTFTKDINDTEDLVQETMLKAISKYHLFTPGTNLKAWVSTIMRNSFLNHYKKKKRHKTDYYSSHEPELSGVVENQGESNILKGEILNQMDSLKPAYRDILKMIIEGYNYEQIAQTHSLPIGTVKSRIHLARKALAAKLKRIEIMN